MAKSIVTVKVTGFKEIDDVLKKLPDSLSEPVIRAANRAAAKPLIDKAKANAPEGPTGHLVDSIGIANKVEEKGSIIKAGKGAVAVGPRRGKGNRNTQGWHAHLVEYGTVKRSKKNGQITGVMPANPFMKPAWLSTQVEVRAKIKEELGKSVKSLMKRTIKKASNL